MQVRVQGTRNQGESTHADTNAFAQTQETRQTLSSEEEHTCGEGEGICCKHDANLDLMKREDGVDNDVKTGKKTSFQAKHSQHTPPHVYSDGCRLSVLFGHKHTHARTLTIP